ncbi:AAA family ATPase [Elizabethkingia anophelis]|uniref:AAA family ATPase n=1 Tax=Elizabethkingia anophelis TaxID=1117645 RepID=UPI0018C22CB9|nr:AAA family ATPase [Elizabethkingia anophelis]MBG0504953.1 AAA family ATPase [Elizabethkingia anophelis]MCT4251701.1 AAA family ATPase [Elizabethkingia anophelis]
MITEIILNNVATYTEETTISDLKKVNFFFGSNGAGKSTLAKYLHNINLDQEKQNINFNSCNQTGYDDTNHQILVYDEKFIERNFIDKDIQKGIFSLNETNEEIDTLISNEQSTLKLYEDYLREKIQKEKENIIKKTEKTYNDLKKYCFEERKNAINSFLRIKEAFPYKQTQNNFDKISNILQNNENLNSITFEELVSDYKKYYEDDLKNINANISKNTYKEIRTLELILRELLDEIIIGNDDVDIAKIINDLNIKSWVEQGITYLNKDLENQICPFCQNETINKSLIDQFEKYFDENYKNKISQIETLKHQYENITGLFLNEIKNVSDTFNIGNKASNLYTELKQIFDDNIKSIELKITSSNEKKGFFSILDFKNKIAEINKSIFENNTNFQNLEKNRALFEDNIWFYLVEKCKVEINNYYINLDKYSEDYFFTLKIEDNVNEVISNSKIKIEEYKNQTVTTKEAVDKINLILKNSGFHGFNIEEKQLENNISQYYLKRNNNNNSSNVFKTLSEGEKNFISFLYFFQLCLGTDNQENSSKKKIIVIDDPVSSLDSQVLFIVTTLIHQLIEKKGKSEKNNPQHLELKNPNIQQVFILSHNIYFHKEVSLHYRPICYDKSFYFIYKLNNVTKIEHKGDKNIVLNDYSLLWSTLKDLKSNTDVVQNITICNTMRRILESYVSFTRIGKDNWDVLTNLSIEDPKYIICSALISDMNDGSHKVSPLDDMYFQRVVNINPQILYDSFELVFKEIAYSHYEAMMS